MSDGFVSAWERERRSESVYDTPFNWSESALRKRMDVWNVWGMFGMILHFAFLQ